jgi:predicted transport protein
MFLEISLQLRNYSVRTKRSRLELNLALKKGELIDPKQVAVDISDKRHEYSTTQYAVNVDDKSDLGVYSFIDSTGI